MATVVDRGWPEVATSSDGGNSWTLSSAIYGGSSATLQLLALSPEMLLLSTTNWTLFQRSNSSGASWVNLDLLPLMTDGFATRPFWGTDITRHYFAGVRHLDNNHDLKVVAESRDGGVTFTPLFATPNLTGYYNGGFRALGPWGAGLVAVGSEGSIAMWTGSGTDWHLSEIQASPSVDFNLNAVSFLDAVTGWAVGDGGRILRY